MTLYRPIYNRFLTLSRQMNEYRVVRDKMLHPLIGTQLNSAPAERLYELSNEVQQKQHVLHVETMGTLDSVLFNIQQFHKGCANSFDNETVDRIMGNSDCLIGRVTSANRLQRDILAALYHNSCVNRMSDPNDPIEYCDQDLDQMVQQAEQTLRCLHEDDDDILEMLPRETYSDLFDPLWSAAWVVTQTVYSRAMVGCRNMTVMRFTALTEQLGKNGSNAEKERVGHYRRNWLAVNQNIRDVARDVEEEAIFYVEGLENEMADLAPPGVSKSVYYILQDNQKTELLRWIKAALTIQERLYSDEIVQVVRSRFNEARDLLFFYNS